jgi:hypothetical protein
LLKSKKMSPVMGIDAVMDEITKNKGVLYGPEAVDACLRLFDEKNDQGAA